MGFSILSFSAHDPSMSEGQKLVTSIVGTVVGHLLLFVLLGVLLFSERGRGAGSEAEKPREVIIALDELMERVEKIEPEPEPLPGEEPEPPRPEPRSFVDTAPVTPADRAPEKARYESDRSTVASTELLPDPDRPQEEGPTLEGDNPLSRLQLQRREHVDGALERPPGSLAVRPASRIPPRVKSPDATGKTAAGENRDPDGTRRSDQPHESADPGRERFFATPSESGGMVPAEESVDGALSRDQAEQEPAQPPSESEKKIETEPLEEIDGLQEEKMKQLFGDSYLGDGFSPESTQNSVNGTLTNRGESTVDAEETALGRYKKAVKDAVAQKWHRYQAEHADSLAAGILKLTFRVDAHGRVKGLKAANRDTDTVLTEFSLQAVKDAEIPPMPEEVSEMLGAGGLELKYDIIIY